MKRDMFDLLAPVYDLFTDSMFSDEGEKIIDNIDLKKDLALLDVGGGTGRLLKKIQKEEPQIEPYLLDTSIKMISESPSENPVVGKACRNPFETSSFDVVFCTDALHHFQNKEESLREMVRVLKPRGQIIILEFDPSSPVTKFIKFGEKLVGEPSSFFEPKDLENFFQKRGLSTTIEKMNSYEYILQASER